MTHGELQEQTLYLFEQMPTELKLAVAAALELQAADISNGKAQRLQVVAFARTLRKLGRSGGGW